MVIYSIDAFADMSQDIKQMRVKIFDELSKIVDPEIATSIVELELIDEVDIQDSNVRVDLHLLQVHFVQQYLVLRFVKMSTIIC